MLTHRKLRVEPLEDRRMLTVLFVDDDGQQFHNAQFTSIQAAVNAANPGDKILVAPGDYAESVTVNKRLSIIGSGAITTTNPNSAAIVDPPAGATETPGFDLEANNITIQGFVIGDFNGDAAANGTIGIYTSPQFSGYKIQANDIEANSIGIYLNSSGGSTTTVSGNLIHDNNLGSGILPAAGNGIYSDQGASKVTISGNQIRNQDNAAILFTGLINDVPYAVTNTNITISGNTIGRAPTDNTGSPIIFVDVTNSAIKGNLLQESNGSAIALTGGCTNITVQGNVIRGAAFTGVNLANLIDLVTPNDNNRILGNVIFDVGEDGGSGIRIRGDASGNLVRGNVITSVRSADPTVAGYGNGITLEDTAHDNRIESNVITRAARDGIFADIGTYDNTIRGNVALLSGNFDLEDLSTGTGTAGTANRWSGNVGRKRNPSGLR